MKHVAKLANVSIMTVSLALREHPSIPEATRRRIRLLAGKVGYRPNPLISALMSDLRSKRSKRSYPVVAFINAYPPDTHWRNLSSLSRYRRAFLRRGEQLGYSISEFHLGPHGVTEARLIGMLKARGIRGVVFAPFPVPETRLKEDWGRFACAVIGYSLLFPQFHCAVNHQIHSLRLAFSELRKLGYKRIGLALSTYEDQRVAHNWMAAFLYERHQAMKEKINLPLFLADTWQEKKILSWVQRFRPEAIVTTNSELREILATGGVTAPHDVGLAYLHLAPEMKGCSGIDQNDELIAESTLELVVEQLHNNSVGSPLIPKIVHLEGVWVPGATTNTNSRAPSVR